MRSISTAEEDLLAGPQYRVHTRLEVEDSTGAFVDIGTLGGANWFESAVWDWDIDTPVPEMRLKVRRDQGPSTGESLAPLDEDSTFNRDASTAFAPLIDVGREFKFFTATVAAGSAAPATSELDLVFQGEIDEVLAWQQEASGFPPGASCTIPAQGTHGYNSVKESGKINDDA